MKSQYETVKYNIQLTHSGLIDDSVWNEMVTNSSVYTMEGDVYKFTKLNGMEINFHFIHLSLKKLRVRQIN